MWSRKYDHGKRTRCQRIAHIYYQMMRYLDITSIDITYYYWFGSNAYTRLYRWLARNGKLQQSCCAPSNTCYLLWRVGKLIAAVTKIHRFNGMYRKLFFAVLECLYIDEALHRQPLHFYFQSIRCRDEIVCIMYICTYIKCLKHF